MEADGAEGALGYLEQLHALSACVVLSEHVTDVEASKGSPRGSR